MYLQFMKKKIYKRCLFSFGEVLLKKNILKLGKNKRKYDCHYFINWFLIQVKCSFKFSFIS